VLLGRVRQRIAADVADALAMPAGDPDQARFSDRERDVVLVRSPLLAVDDDPVAVDLDADVFAHESRHRCGDRDPFRGL